MLKFATLLLLGYTSGLKLRAEEAQCGLKVQRGTKYSARDGQVIKDLHIIADPTTDTALHISHKNVTVENVVIHHAANGRGLFFWKAHGLQIRNVEIVAYGVHGSGAQPCPNRAPFQGFNCNNLIGYNTDGLIIDNVRVEGGSKGISVQASPGATLNNVAAKNVRGPFPGGQCFQIARSDDVTMTNFHCLNEQGSSWTEDSVSAWRSSNVTLRHGVVDGNNGPNGICVMFEGSEEHVHGGLVEDVDGIHCQGCFSGYPSNGLVMRQTTCADSWCDGTPERGKKKMFNMWQFGNNKVENVWGKNNEVWDSHYYDTCDNSRVTWQPHDREFDLLVHADISPLESYTPREPIHHTFSWTGCDELEVPATQCEDFPMARIEPFKRVDVHSGKVTYDDLPGQCLPNPSNPKHPKEP